MTGGGRWAVRARVERFVEPAVLLLLRDGPKHGYELLEKLPEIAEGGAGLDVGNLYRLLRALEEESFVTSTWRADLPGPAKRTYRLTASGAKVLGRWADALRGMSDVIDGFLDRYDHPEGR
jgi:PadR family transcriptional regulator PadR